MTTTNPLITEARRLKAMYVYIKSEPLLWTVGFYDPTGKWQPDSDHDNKASAASRVSFLNGHGAADIFADQQAKIEEHEREIAILKERLQILREDTFHHHPDDVEQIAALQAQVEKLKAEFNERYENAAAKFNRKHAQDDAEIERLSLLTDSQAEQISTLQTQNTKLREACEVAQTLVSKLDAVHEDPQFKSVWTLHHVHGGRYTGLTYEAELNQARKQLRKALETK